jgi:hypothetical protein
MSNKTAFRPQTNSGEGREFGFSDTVGPRKEAAARAAV